MNLQNSETQKNLMRALAGESLARNRYTFAAQQAEQEGLPVIAAVFRYTAGQEKEHAEIFADFLRQGGADSVCVEGDFPVDTAADTLSLLAAGLSRLRRCGQKRRLCRGGPKAGTDRGDRKMPCRPFRGLPQVAQREPALCLPAGL